MVEDVVCSETFMSEKLTCRSFLFISTESRRERRTAGAQRQLRVLNFLDVRYDD